jgi:hypothetical protein
MVTGFDILTHDRRLRRYWLLRALAFITDALIVFIPVTLLLWWLNITDVITIGLTASLSFYLYSVTLETAARTTIGKRIFRMKVHQLKSGMWAARMFGSNLNRLLWFVLPPLDFAFGITMRGDPRQTLLDVLSNTVTLTESEAAWQHEKQAENVEGQEQKESKSPQPGSEATEKGQAPKCRSCGGKLLSLADEKLQCEKCGLIQ